MASAPPPGEGIGDDFLEQFFAMPGYGGGEGMVPSAGDIGLQLRSGEGSSAAVVGGGSGTAVTFPLKLGLDQSGAGFVAEAGETVGSVKRLWDNADDKAPARLERTPLQLASLIPAFGHIQPHQHRPNPPQQIFHGHTQSQVATTQQAPAPRPRVRARRGQATDPHSIAERLRRERIAERMRALQELLPNSNKTDRAAMLDEVLDYVKFLKLQVKVLSMSRLGGTGAVAQLVADIPLSSAEVLSDYGRTSDVKFIKGDKSDAGNKQHVWEKWSTDGTERQVAKLMEDDIGQAMQFLQSKALCIMPVSLARAIYSHHQAEPPSTIKPEPNTPA